MFLVCAGCGEYSESRPVVDGAVSCECGHRQPIRLLPHFLILGPSGVGKSTLAVLLPDLIPEVVSLDSDILWSPDMDTPDDDYQRFRTVWLRMAFNIHQAGRPLLLLGSATADSFATRPLRDYVGPIHTLALVCDDDVLRERLRSRPAWRGWTEKVADQMVEWNDILRRDRWPTIDTTHHTPAEVAAQIRAWVVSHL